MKVRSLSRFSTLFFAAVAIVSLSGVFAVAQLAVDKSELPPIVHNQAVKKEELPPIVHGTSSVEQSDVI